MQDQLGVDVAALVDDLQTTTVHRLVSAIEADMATARNRSESNLGPSGSVHIAVYATPADSFSQPGHTQEWNINLPFGPLWIASGPISIKMRIFCLPYAGGVSENIYAR